MFSIKLYLKGTMHIKFHPDFITKLNILHGKLSGWVKDWKEAANEMDINPDFAKTVFNEPLLKIDSSILLLEKKEEKEEPEIIEEVKPKKEKAVDYDAVAELKNQFKLF